MRLYPNARILLVDDVRANLLALEGVLEPLGAELVLASSGEAALEKLSTGSFACVLLDVQMPGLDGYETAKRIRAREGMRHVPIIFVTAINRDEAHVMRGYAEGAVDYLAKPYSPDVLRAKVAAILELEEANARSRAEADSLRARLDQQERHTREVEQNALMRAESERARLYSVFTQAPFPIFVVHGPTFVFDFINPRAHRLFGMREVIGRSAHSAVPAPAWALYFEKAEEAWRTGRETLARGLPSLTGDGQSIFDFIYEPLRDESGRVAGVMVCGFDVTELVHARQEAESAVRVRDDFFSVASHELKTPLTPLLMRLDALSHLTDGMTPAVAESLKHARRHARRAVTLIEGLLDVSRASVGKLEVVLQDGVDLAELVREVVARHAEETHSLHVAMELEAPSELKGRTDPLRLEQVLTNLVSNALKYGNGKPVRITVTSTDEHARFAVEDQGVGIPAEVLPRIFQKFDRGAAPAGTKGLGLGLYITRELVDALGGTLRVESNPGKGSRFEVELPLRRRDSDASSPTAAVDPA